MKNQGSTPSDHKQSNVVVMFFVFILIILLIGFALALTEFLSASSERTFIKRLEYFLYNAPYARKSNEDAVNSSSPPQEDLAQGPDWWLIYRRPTCVKIINDESPINLGEQRLHWIDGKPGDITGSDLEGAPVTFRGTYEGSHLDFTDKAHFQDGTPIHIVADVSYDRKKMTGNYTIKAGNKNFAGDCAGVDVTGSMEANPCKDLKGTICP